MYLSTWSLFDYNHKFKHKIKCYLVEYFVTSLKRQFQTKGAFALKSSKCQVASCSSYLLCFGMFV